MQAFTNFDDDFEGEGNNRDSMVSGQFGALKSIKTPGFSAQK